MTSRNLLLRFSVRQSDYTPPSVKVFKHLKATPIPGPFDPEKDVKVLYGCEPGEYYYFSSEEKTEITSQMIRECVQQFNQDPAPHPFLRGHSDANLSMTGEEAPAAGFILGLHVDPTGKLWCAVQYTKSMRQQVEAGEYAFTSVYINPQDHDYKTGKKTANLVSLAATNNPFLRHSPAMSLSLSKVLGQKKFDIQGIYKKGNQENHQMGILSKNMTPEAMKKIQDKITMAKKTIVKEKTTETHDDGAPAPDVSMANPDTGVKMGESSKGLSLAENATPADTSAVDQANKESPQEGQGLSTEAQDSLNKILDALKAMSGQSDLSLEDALGMLLDYLAAEGAEEQAVEPSEQEDGAMKMTKEAGNEKELLVLSTNVRTLERDNKTLQEKLEAQEKLVKDLMADKEAREKQALELEVKNLVDNELIDADETATFIRMSKLDPQSYKDQVAKREADKKKRVEAKNGRNSMLFSTVVKTLPGETQNSFRDKDLSETAQNMRSAWRSNLASRGFLKGTDKNTDNKSKA